MYMVIICTYNCLPSFDCFTCCGLGVASTPLATDCCRTNGSVSCCPVPLNRGIGIETVAEVGCYKADDEQNNIYHSDDVYNVDDE